MRRGEGDSRHRFRRGFPHETTLYVVIASVPGARTAEHPLLPFVEQIRSDRRARQPGG